jgi:YceI-like domain
MMQRLFLFLLLFIGQQTYCQDLHLAKNAEISFYSDTPVEAISAMNKKALAILNTQTREVAVKVVVSQFDFPHKLMQEHFNENYLDAEKYPNATFQGKINEEIDWKKEGMYDITVLGKLTIHGTTVGRNITGKLFISKDDIYISGSFKVLLEEHKIKIPNLLIMRVADAVLVRVKLSFLPYK